MRFVRSFAFVGLVALVGGCAFTGSGVRYSAAPGTVAEPYWCAPSGRTPLGVADCQTLSVQLDLATLFAGAHGSAGQATAAGAVGSGYVTGVGAAFRFADPTATFDAGRPDTLLYDGTGASAQIAGIEYNVAASTAPDGFEGPNDDWTETRPGVWRLRVWTLRPFQDQRNVFAASHPCLGASGPVYDTNAACYTDTHPRPLEVLVSNDDGYGAPGIDAIVQALRAFPKVHVTVSAPAANQSGAGSKFTDGPVTATDQQTASGYPAWAVEGFPVDAVRYALRTRHVDPDLVVAGTNNGQNIGGAIPLSGTVGAAREGAQGWIPALAISQGLGSPADFPASATALDAWLDDFLLGLAGRPALEPVTNINVPTCTAGSIRGTVHVPVGPGFVLPSDCTSTVTNPPNDVAAFANGFISVSALSATSGAGH
jgi:5'-nucleotidase